MKPQRKISWLTLIGAMASGFGGVAAIDPAHAQSDMFLCIDGVQGSSTDAQFAGCSNLVGYSQAVEVRPSGNAGGGGGAPKPLGCGEAVVVKQIDNASPILFTRVLLGIHTPSAIVHFRTQGGNPVEFLTITLQDVLVTGIENSEFSGAGGASRLPISMETVKLSARQVFFSFARQLADGSLGLPIESAFDCATGQRL